MSDNDADAQRDELLALSSIYEDSFTSLVCDDPDNENNDSVKGGVLQVHIELRQPFYLIFKNKINGTHVRHSIEFLPPLILNFKFPPVYPSRHPPIYTLSCKWLSCSQLSSLCKKLDDLWESNLYSEIMFSWAQLLKEETLDILSIDDFLDIESICPKWSRKLSLSNGTSNGDSKSCDTSEFNSEIGAAAAFSNSTQFSKVDETLLACDSRAIQTVGPHANLLFILREFDEEMRKSVFESKVFECKICFSDKLGYSCIKFWPCHHVYCKNCISCFFEVQINEGNVKFLRCPELKCDSEANPKQVEDLVSEELYAKWDEMLLSTTLSSLGDIQPCPRKHCQYPVTIEESQGQCPSCSFVFCGFCRFGAHGIERCKFKSGDARKILELYMGGNLTVCRELEDRYGKKYLVMMVNEYLSINYINLNAKECPRCRSNIEKIDGCNKMTCKRCTSNFCWLCEKIIDKMNPYNHFNNPDSECYNMLFHGMAIDNNQDFVDENSDEEPEFW